MYLSVLSVLCFIVICVKDSLVGGNIGAFMFSGLRGNQDSGQHVLGMTEAAFHCLKRWLEAIDFKVSFEVCFADSLVMPRDVATIMFFDIASKPRAVWPHSVQWTVILG